MNNIKKISPWAWVPTLYFAQGIPYQTFLEPVCRHYQNQKMVGSFHADSYVDSFHPADPDHSASGRSNHGSGHDSYQYVHRNLDTVYHHGIRFRHTRYCRRRVLYAGIEIGRAG